MLSTLNGIKNTLENFKLYMDGMDEKQKGQLIKKVEKIDGQLTNFSDMLQQEMARREHQRQKKNRG